MSLLARVPDNEIAILVWLPENLRDIALARQIDLRVVRRYILDRQDMRLFCESRVDLAFPLLVFG